MKQLTKNILTGLISLSMVAPLATTALSNSSIITAHANSQTAKLPYRMRNIWHGSMSKTGLKYIKLYGKPYIYNGYRRLSITRITRYGNRYDLNVPNADPIEVWYVNGHLNGLESGTAYIKLYSPNNHRVRKPHYSKYDKESIKDGKQDLRSIGQSTRHSDQYLINMENELAMTDEAAGVPAKQAKKAVNWIVRHGETLLLKKDEYWDSFDHNRSIMRVINKSIHGKDARKQAYNGRHAKAHTYSNFYVYNPKKFGKKGYDLIYTTGFNTKRAYKSHFKRSDNSEALKKSGFKDLRKYGANFIFNKYAPSNPKALVPKDINFEYTGWYQGSFGKNHPKVFAYYGHNIWYLHK